MIIQTLVTVDESLWDILDFIGFNGVNDWAVNLSERAINAINTFLGELQDEGRSVMASDLESLVETILTPEESRVSGIRARFQTSTLLTIDVLPKIEIQAPVEGTLH